MWEFSASSSDVIRVQKLWNFFLTPSTVRFHIYCLGRGLRRSDISVSPSASNFGQIRSGRQALNDRWDRRPDVGNPVPKSLCTSRDGNHYSLLSISHVRKFFNSERITRHRTMFSQVPKGVAIPSTASKPADRETNSQCQWGRHGERLKVLPTFCSGSEYLLYHPF